MTMCKRFFLLALLFSSVLILDLNSTLAEIGRPYYDEYPNPYVLMEEDDILTDERRAWPVICNREYAPILDTPGGTVRFEANYLEIFEVLDREDGYLQIFSKTRENITGWMDMRHLILTQQAIMDPYKSVYHKVFLKVRLQGEGETESGLNSLRFRAGPGEGIEPGMEKAQEESYYFLTDQDERVRDGSLFFYVYGIHFNTNEKTDDYQDASKFKDADYFLVGETQSISLTDIDHGVIFGWIPRSAAVLWDTRQALEKVANRPEEDWDAHKFISRTLLYQYFSLSNQQEKQLFLEDNSEQIVRDFGEDSLQSGQDLRDIVLQVGYGEREFAGVTSESIGYIGRYNQGGRGTQQSFLAQLQEGAKNVELFFLVDATLSMGPCLEAVTKVTQKIITQLQTEDLNIKVRGAVYRDVSEDYGRYEEWEPSTDPSLYQWFQEKEAYSIKGDDYYEDLFNAINQAIDGWSNNFFHPLSVRVMIILGDAGNATDDGIYSILEKFTDNMIFPLAIHFAHPHRKSEDTVLEQNAMNAFINQLNFIHQRIYTMEELQSVRSMPEEALTGNLEIYATSVSNTFVQIIKELPKVRRGQKSFCDTLCEVTYESAIELIPNCKSSCSSEETFLQYLQNYAPQPQDGASESNIGIALAYLNALKKDNPELWEYVKNRPEASFSEGFVAVRKNGRPITQPILLLEVAELELIKQAISNIRTKHRFCSDVQNRELLIKAMSTILGEALQTNPDAVSVEKLNRWLETSIVDAERSFLGVDEIITEMCQNGLWEKFLSKLENAEQTIVDLVYKERPESRLYRDMQGSPYFWVYPEELFPQPQQLNEINNEKMD